MIEILCLSDLHLGETYSFLDRRRFDDWRAYSEALIPFYRGIARLAGLKFGDEPRVKIRKLVLLGDVFELATARLTSAADSGRNFFGWLFQWLDADEIIYVPGNHDHVFWMWWKTCIQSGKEWWSQPDPEADKKDLEKIYDGVSEKCSDPFQPEPAVEPLRRRLVSFFFGERALNENSFCVGYPVYCGPNAAPAGYPDPCFRTFFTHGHLVDPTFVRPAESDFVGLVMNVLSWGWGKDAEHGSLTEMEESTWKYTNKWWYPPKEQTSLGERLYLFSTRFGENNPCRHRAAPPYSNISEIAPDVADPNSSNNDFYDLLSAALGEKWFMKPRMIVYGHTHHGGELAIEPSVLLYNTGGWLTKVNDRPIHTHLFAITDIGLTQMMRVEFHS
jgi:UDP-2,3-diacylglucosamine pyrophosphatase LpxH